MFALTYQMLYEQPVRHEISLIAVSTLLVIGQADRTALGRGLVPDEALKGLGDYPELGRAAARDIPGSRLLEVQGVGHLPHLEWPDRFNAALIGFLAPWRRKKTTVAGASGSGRLEAPQGELVQQVRHIGMLGELAIEPAVPLAHVGEPCSESFGVAGRCRGPQLLDGAPRILIEPRADMPVERVKRVPYPFVMIVGSRVGHESSGRIIRRLRSLRELPFADGERHRPAARPDAASTAGLLP
ncbi:MAG: hypothetical protein ABI682_09540, partial [Acidobacteriota bacterium]